MKPQNARACAAQVLAEVFTQRVSLNTALQKKLKTFSHSRDRGFVQELCYGVLRWYWQLDAITKILLKRSLKAKDANVHALLLIGLYQLIHLQTPEHAAIYETVQATRSFKKNWAAGLINAALRRFQHQHPEIMAQIAQTPEAFYSHPKWLLTLLQKTWPEYWETIINANNQYPPLTLRVNHAKLSRDEYLHKLTENNIAATLAEFTQQGITLVDAQDVTQLPGFAAGEFSVQDAAAQLSAELLELAPNQTVLDACAAPGGKTAQILETEPQLTQLIALDVDAERLQRIAENLQRLQLQSKTVQLIAADATQPNSWWQGQLFDRILLDAPCSSMGVIRRHPDIKYLRRFDDIANLAALQKQLLTTLWKLLKPGGLLLYATCSILPAENIENMQWFLSNHDDAKEHIIEANWGIKMPVGRQLLPQTQGHDGFYFARLNKAVKLLL